MKLFGTTTSPFVRRVRVVAAELDLTVELVSTAGEAGLAVLREVAPIRKVPLAIVDDHMLFDSRVIIEYLTMTRGYGELAPTHDRWRDQNIINAIDGALDAIIQLFYLRRDGVAIDGTVYAERQLERADAIFAWLGNELAADGRSFGHGFGLAEIALVSALDWMDFRATYPTERAAVVASVRAAWRERASLVATRPVA
jgi:glutathione S-transferase